MKLAYIGSMMDLILFTVDLAAILCEFFNYIFSGILAEKYDFEESDDGFAMLQEIAKSRHCLVKGNEYDTEKAAKLMLDDFRNGRLGRITLEFPDEMDA